MTRAVELWLTVQQALDEVEANPWDADKFENMMRAVRLAEEETGWPWAVLDERMEAHSKALLYEAA